MAEGAPARARCPHTAGRRALRAKGGMNVSAQEPPAALRVIRRSAPGRSAAERLRRSAARVLPVASLDSAQGACKPLGSDGQEQRSGRS